MLSTGYGQNKTIIDKSGKVTFLSYSGDQVSPVSTDGLKEHDADLKKNHRSETKKLIKATLANLNNQRNNLRLFYDWLWGKSAVDKLEKDLKTLESYMDKDNTGAITLTELTTIQTLLDKHLFKGESFTGSTISPQNVQLWQKDLFKIFLIEYYNDCYKNATTAITDYNLDQLLSDSRFLEDRYAAASKILREVHKSPLQVSAAILHRLQDFHTGLNAGQFLTIKNGLLQDKWFKQWIWINGGSLRLNPLKFTTSEYLKKYPGVDTEKSGIYEEYLDSLAARYVRNDSTERIESFRKILAEMGTGKSKYTLSDRANAEKNNQKEIQELLVTTRLVNDVMIPESKPCSGKPASEKPKWLEDNPLEFQNFSFSEKDQFSASNEIENYTTRPVRAGTEKVLVVHNTPAAFTLEVQEKKTASNDRSDVQVGIDSIISFATQLSALAVTFSPYGAYLAPQQLISNRAISIADLRTEHQQRALIEDPNAAPGQPTIGDFLEIILEKNEKFDQNIFNWTGTKMPDNFDIDAVYTGSQQQKNDTELFLTIYKGEFSKRLETAVELVQKDSLYLSHLSTAFSESTLPPSELKSTKNDKAIFYSKVLKTKPSDDPVKHEISIVGKNDKDSVIVNSFKFKTGKTYRFQLSAGIAYTMSKFSQTTAKEEDGKIVISNTAQQYRFVMGVHIHWGNGLFLQDNRLFGNFWERSAAFIGVGIPKPLENVYLGYSYDLFPGLKTTLGAQFVRNNKYTIQNNTIMDERMRYQVACPFLAVQIDPTGLLNALNLLFKKD